MTTHAAPGDGSPLGLFTDLYELRMAQTYLRGDMTADATFTLYVRPSRQRPWLLAAGLHRVHDLLEGVRRGRTGREKQQQ